MLNPGITGISSSEKELLLQRIKKKTVSIGSGKGGVGKTTTAVNIALFSAMHHLRTAIIDLDPLSDIAVLLDISNLEVIKSHRAKEGPEKTASGALAFQEMRTNVCRNLDLLFPDQKLGKLKSAGLIQTIYSTYLNILDEEYDLIILDLPAGEGYEDNIMFLSLAETALVVTNPEPTAHVSAGGYIKKIFQYFPETAVHVWHNKYTSFSSLNFDSSEVALNYNRNVQEEIRFQKEEATSIKDIAFVPPDPSLDLLRTEPKFLAQILSKITDLLVFIREQKIEILSQNLPFSKRTLEIIKYYLGRNRDIADIDDYILGLGEYITSLTTEHIRSLVKDADTPIEVFTGQQKKSIFAFLEALKDDPSLKDINRLIRLLEEKTASESEKEKIFSSQNASTSSTTLDRELTQLLMKLNSMARHETDLVAPGGLFLFYFSMYKLLESESTKSLIAALIPNKGGNRDRRKQIRFLVEKDQEYRDQFKNLAKKFYPILYKQIGNIASVLNIPHLIYTTKDHKINNRAYMKLLTNSLHDLLFSGLGIVAGFEYRSAAFALQKGVEKIIALISD